MYDTIFKQIANDDGYDRRNGDNMNNTVLVESKTKQRLKTACIALYIFCICFIAFLVSIVMIGKQNLNGQVKEVTGTLKELYKDDSNSIKIDDEYYNVVWDDEEVKVNWSNYLDKTITVVIPQKTFGASNPWILGLKADNTTIVDYQKTIDEKTAKNNELKTVIIIVTAIVCAAACGISIWRFNIEPFAERELCHEFAEFLTQRQPTCPERKKCNLFIYIFCAVIFILAIVGAIVTNQTPELSTAGIVIIIVFSVIAVSGITCGIILSVWVTRKEIDFYANNMPFDFSDISHAPIRKKYKEALQKDILQERELYPDRYSDGGNGYDVTFGNDGVILSVPDENDEQPIAMPNAEEVFAYTETADNTPEQTSDSVYAVSANKQIKLSYKELNFEAVAHYRKHSHPMMIIIKSRLTRTDDFPEEFVNDIHIPYDTNLQKTFDKYHVEAENLDYLLNNRKQLMIENCLKRRKKVKNMTE